jgi:hypothetical protein
VAYTSWLVIPLGILSTTQTHLAKALERQGIEALWSSLRPFDRRLAAAISPDLLTA